MKGQKWVDVQKQGKKAVPGDKTYPTVSTDSVLITVIIYAHDIRDVGICKIPGAFLSVEMDEDVKMALSGRLEELVVNIAPQIYRNHRIYEKGRPVLYVNLTKALYT